MHGKVYEHSSFFRVVPDILCHRRIRDVLTDTEFTLFYEQMLKMFWLE